MNRKDFIKGIVASSAGLFFPIFLFQEYKNIEPATKLHFVGLGAAGGNFLMHIHNKKIDARYTYIDKKPKQKPCPANMNFIKFCPEQDTQIVSLIQTNFRKDETIVLLAGLGGKTGTNLSVALFGQLQAARYNVFLVATIPFDYEEERQRYAAFILQAMGRQKNISLISNQKCREDLGNLIYHVWFSTVDDIVYKKAIEMIV